MAGTTAEQVKRQADVLRSENSEELKDASQDALTDSENLAELQSIRAEADAEERDPSRERPGFFERILSFFSFSSKYKSGEMSSGRNKKRSGKSYEDFLIAKLSYQTGGDSAYEAAGDGLTFSRSGGKMNTDIKNDSAAISQTRTDEGQSIRTSTNITYYDRVRLINADANFKHRILGDSTAAYSSEKVQLKLLGEFRDLNLLDKRMTLLHNYTAGTDKFGAIASADFDDARSGVRVSTGAFFMRDGSGAPRLSFKKGRITLSTEDFTVKLNAPSSDDGKAIVSDRNVLSITGLDKTTEINSEIFLTDSGIIPPEVLPDDGSPVLTRDETGKLRAGVLIDGENGGEIVAIGETAEAPEDENEPAEEDEGSTMKLGPVTFTGVKRSVELNGGLNVKFSAKGATIDNVDFLKLGETKAGLQLSGNKPSRAVLESTSLIFPKFDFMENVTLFGSEIAVDGDGVSFEEISLGAKDFDIGFLKAEEAAVKLTKEEEISVSAEAENISIEAKLGGLEFSAEDLSGELTFPKGSPDLNITGGSVSAGADVLRLTLDNLRYSDGTLDFGSARTTTKNISLFGVAELSNVTAETTAGSITKKGLSMGNDPALKLSADFSLLERKLGGLEFDLDNEGFGGTFEFEDKAQLISSDQFSLSASGKIGFDRRHASGKLLPVTKDFSAGAELFGLLDISADHIEIDSENRQFTASEMSGGVKDILTVTGKDVKLGKGGAGFSEITAEYGEFELFGGVISVDSGKFTAKSPEKFEGGISAGFSAGGVSASVSAELEFTKERSYFPAITGIDEFSLEIGDSKLEGAKLSAAQDSDEKALDFSAEKLSVGRNEKVSITNISGSASKDRFALDSADVSINDLFGIGSLSGKITNMTAGSDGVFFEKLSFGSQKISLGETMSAGSAEISLSKTREDGFSVTASADDINSQLDFTPFSLETSGLSGNVTYADGRVSVGTKGDITLGLADLLSLTLTDLEYGDKVLSFNSVRAELLKDELFGGAVKLSGLAATAEKVSFSRDGISAGGDSGLTITADEISLLGAGFGGLEATVTSDGFTAEAEASIGSSEKELFPNVKAALSGKLSLNYSRDDRLSADLNDVSAFISVFENQLSAENITAGDDSVRIDTIRGDFALPGFGRDSRVSMTGKDLSFGKEFHLGSIEAQADGELKFFNDMLSISNVGFKAADSLDSFTVNGSVGFSAGAFSTAASGTVSAKKSDHWRPKLVELNNLGLTIERIGSIKAGSIAPDKDDPDQLDITDITVETYDPKGENASFLESIAGSNKIGVTLGLLKYSGGKFRPDMSTLRFSTNKLTLAVTDSIKGTVDFEERSLAIQYGIALPKDFKGDNDADFPKLASASVYVPLLPGVSVKGSAFAGAGMKMDMSLKAMFGSLETGASNGKDGVSDKSGITTFDLKGSAGLTAKAGGGVEASLMLGVPGLANIEAGIRGTISGQTIGSEVSGSIGINYDKGQKKFSVAKDGRTAAAVKFNASLVAALKAFVGGQLFAVFNKDLCTFKIGDFTLVGVNFSGDAKYTDDGWKFSAKELDLSSDFNKLFQKRGVTVDITKHNLKMGELESLLGEASKNCAPLFGGKLGAEEATEAAARCQVQIFPALADLRKLTTEAFQSLSKADRQFDTEENNAWEAADVLEISTEEADRIVDELRTSPGKLNDLAGQLVKTPDIFRNRTSHIDILGNGLLNTSDVRKHIEERPGYRSPAAILAALSKNYNFDSHDKDEWLQAQMKRFIDVRVAINSVYRNPVEKDYGTAELTTYGLRISDLNHAAQMQKNGISKDLSKYNAQIAQSEKEYKELDKKNKQLVTLLTEIDEETKKAANPDNKQKTKPGKDLKTLLDEKADLMDKIGGLRSKVMEGAGKDRSSAITGIYHMSEALKSAREQLNTARDIYHYKDAKKKGSLLDVSEFVRDQDTANPIPHYNIRRLLPFLGPDYEVKETSTFVSKNEFSRAAWTALLHNVDENERELARFLDRKSEKSVKTTDNALSPQILKMIYSNSVFAETTGKTRSKNVDYVDRKMLQENALKKVADTRKEAAEQESKMRSIEELTFKSTEMYIRAEKLYLELTKIQPENFANEIKNSSDPDKMYIEPANDYQNAVNTLRENIQVTGTGGLLSFGEINRLKSRTEAINPPQEEPNKKAKR